MCYHQPSCSSDLRLPPHLLKNWYHQGNITYPITVHLGSFCVLKNISFKNLRTSWWFQPIWNICSSKWIISPRIGVNIKNVWNHDPVFFWGILEIGKKLPYTKTHPTIFKGDLGVTPISTNQQCRVFFANQALLPRDVGEVPKPSLLPSPLKLEGYPKKKCSDKV